MTETKRDCEHNLAYAVDLWGSHPDDDNDDCWTGRNFGNIGLARECAFNLVNHFTTTDIRDSAYVVIDGPGFHEIISNPAFCPGVLDDNSARSEAAMQAGMGFGCQGYNDMMGY